MGDLIEFPETPKELGDLLGELNAVVNRITAAATQYSNSLAVLVDALEKTNRNLETTCKMLAIVTAQLEEVNSDGKG